ncbi:MAG TPA: FAD-dependent oxidoreductase, partial [Solirubrobacteraceae bacterium]
FDRELGAEVVAVQDRGDQVAVQTRSGQFVARAAVVAVPVNVLGGISLEPTLDPVAAAAVAGGQASRGIKIFIHARGKPVLANAIRPAHPFGYLSTEELFDDGTQLLIGFGPDAERYDSGSLAVLQRSLDDILPGYQALRATNHDWLADEFSRGTWAIHRPGWYEHYHAAMRRPEGRILLAGSDLADGWAGFIDGAIESGLRAGRTAVTLGD